MARNLPRCSKLARAAIELQGARASVEKMAWRGIFGRGCRWGTLVVVFGGLGTTSHCAVAAELPMTTNATATEGMSAYAAGRFEEANEKLSRALDLVGVPTLALYAARTNVQLAHWVKASELYLLATRLDPKSAADINLLQAQHEAEKERADLLARIPRMTIVLMGEDLENVEVTLDSEPVPKALFGANQLVDPGHHVVCALRDGQLVTGDVDILERQHKTTTLYFARREPRDAHAQTLPSIATSTEHPTERRMPAPPAKPIVADRPSLDAAPNATSRDAALRTTNPILDPSRTADHDDSTTTSSLGWVGVGLGAAGVVVGATAGLLAQAARNDLSASCVDNQCSPSATSEVDRYNRLRNWSTATFVAGGVLAATGITLLLVEPSRQHATHATLLVGPVSAAVLGRF